MPNAAPVSASVGSRPSYPAQTQTPADTGVAENAAASKSSITGRKAELLREALTDVQNFWLHDDPRALRRRIASGGMVAVFQSEKFAYSLKRTDFLALATDTLDKTQTRTFEFKRVVARNDGLVNAYAAHTFRVPKSVDQSMRRATVRATLSWDGSQWLLSAVSFSPDSLD